jgi:hypothetical protein
MKYRIKIITYKSGRKTYSPQFKTFFGYKGLSYTGETRPFSLELESREQALTFIDYHYNGNSKVQTIEVEYITK